jgi:uncharacterized protein YyaL (SSP411 family)
MSTNSLPIFKTGAERFVAGKSLNNEVPMSRKQGETPNRLIREKSPYLLQHARNPVDWYPWGEDAFAVARERNCPILVSIGYSTCHWCHVMERESFEDPAVAEIMNRYFVSIKVDREERPDVDAVYMNAVQALTGSGGWPLNVFLTPERKPFFGGTYFPPETRHGIISWPDLLNRIADLWRTPEQRQRIDESAERLTHSLADITAASDAPPARSANRVATEAVAQLKKTFDATFGGFGQAPKFPMPPLMDFLLSRRPSGGESPSGEQRAAAEMLTATLDAIAKGGIRDHIGGGFHRYATDRRWHVPHFEKMLYDNALLAATYARAYSVSGSDEYRQVTGDTIAYVLRDLGHPDGGFFSAEDADSPRPEAPDAGTAEGAFYVWTYDAAAALLDPAEMSVAAAVFGLRPGGNVTADPHGEFAGKNIPYAAMTVPAAAVHCGVDAAAAATHVAAAQEKLFAARCRRPRPHRDEKILTEWNAMMITALAESAVRLDEPRWLDDAARAAAFLREHLYDADHRQLYRRWCRHERQVTAMAADYAHLVNALVDLFGGRADPAWLDWAVQLADELVERFFDQSAGGFRMADMRHADDLIVNTLDTTDGVVPSASAMAAWALLRLGRMLHIQRYVDAAEVVLAAQAPKLANAPAGAPLMLRCLEAAEAPAITVFVAGAPQAPDTMAMAAAARRHSDYRADVVVIPSSDVRRALSRHLPAAGHMAPAGASATAYVCIGTQCTAPETDPDAVARLLTEKGLGR